MNLTFTLEDATSSLVTTLSQELNAELDALYETPGVTGDFHPTDFTVPRSAFVIAWIDGEVVGCGALRPLVDAHDGEVKRMYVRPAFRGRGIARHLLEHLQTLARAFQYDYLRLETGTLQREAITLYEHNGFYAIPNYGASAEDEWTVYYEKKL